MTGSVVNRLRRGFYMDSVALMRLSRRIGGMTGVENAALMMGTPANKQILTDAGLLAGEGEDAKGGDLIIALRAADPAGGRAALDEAEKFLLQPARVSGDDAARQPRTIRSAIRATRAANLALISVPGEFAAAEARKAIRRGLNVMLFSDNVSVDAEAALKREACERGVLMMGPDCGTAIINGVPLAFANNVRQGDIGIIGASGTGIQEVSCLISENGGGISQAIGVGGRDLSATVGGITTLMAFDALDADPATHHIVLISKPPAAAVAQRIIEHIQRSDKACTVCFIGAGQPSKWENVTFAATLKHAAESALSATLPFDAAGSGLPVPAGRSLVRGLYTGGTLAAEARAIFLAAGQAVGTAGDGDGDTHRIIDLGDDAYTRGRPHPMIDPEIRIAPLKDALAEPTVGVVLLDVVLGYGAHPDPAGPLVAALAGLPTGPAPAIVASVTGTEADPQVRSSQVGKLTAAGITVAPSNADATGLAIAAIGKRG
ncbi:MAG: acyl-CoA synthetase FdrA [Alphaproteobacteria bacterium]